MNVPLVLLNRRRRGSVGYNPAGLFALNEPGIWLDPSDLTTMFQDRAGSTAVTTPGQSVGYRLDKSKGLVLGSELVTNGDFSNPSDWTASANASVSSGVGRFTPPTANGNNITTSAVLPLVAGRYYRVTFTVKNYVAGDVRPETAGGGSPAIGTNRTANGTYTEYLLAGTGDTRVRLRTVATNTNLEVDDFSVKELPGNHAVANSDAARGIYGIEPLGGRRNLLLNTTTMATQNVTVTAVAHTLSFTGTGTVTLSGVSTAGPLVGTGANDRVSLTFTPTAGTLTLTVSGSVTLAQLQVGSSFDAYQRVGTTQYDVTEAGKQTLHYVQYDGSDDGYVTPTITPGTDKVQVFAGVRKLANGNNSCIAELSTAVTNPGSFAFLTGRSNSGTAPAYTFASRGSLAPFYADTSDLFDAPITNVLTGLGDISGDLATLRVNGTQAAQSTADQGTGNYLAYPLYIGRRAGTTLPFNGRDYGILVRFGANLDAATITATESWLNQKTGAY